MCVEDPFSQIQSHMLIIFVQSVTLANHNFSYRKSNIKLKTHITCRDAFTNLNVMYAYSINSVTVTRLPSKNTFVLTYKVLVVAM